MTEIRLDLESTPEEFGNKLGSHLFPALPTKEDWNLLAIPKGMQSGRTSIMLVVPVQVGKTRAMFVSETSLNCWMLATAALRSKFQDEVEQPGWAVLSEDARAVILPRYAEALRRVQPSLTNEQAMEAVTMMIDSLGADRPND